MRKCFIHRHKMIRRGQWNFLLTKKKKNEKNLYAPATLMNHNIRKEKETNQSSFDDIKLFIKSREHIHCILNLKRNKGKGNCKYESGGP